MHGRFVTERILNALHSDSNRCPLIDQFLPNQSFCDEDAAEDDIHMCMLLKIYIGEQAKTFPIISRRAAGRDTAVLIL